MNSKTLGRDKTETFTRCWHFSGCEFEELSLQLRINGSPVELELKPLEVLQQLLLHAGDVVSKEELLESVWPGLNVVDGSLATAVSKLRKAFGDENIILTVPRIGYRLAVRVQSGNLSTSTPWVASGSLEPGDPVPGREHWHLTCRLDLSTSSEVWLAEHPKTHEQRVFRFAASEARLRGLKREVTVGRFLLATLGDRVDFVRVLEWNLENPPYLIESEYGGSNLAMWAEQNGGLAQIPLSVRISIVADVCKAVAAAHAAGVLHKDLKPANVLVNPQSDGTWQVNGLTLRLQAKFDKKSNSSREVFGTQPYRSGQTGQQAASDLRGRWYSASYSTYWGDPVTTRRKRCRWWTPFHFCRESADARVTVPIV
jgi:eukaryotic-like serine/threonine-protein kinase